MNSYIHTVMHPEVYHEGWLNPPFFEGWYFKLVDHSQENAYAIIPGAFRKAKTEDSHAFIQVLDGNSGNVRVFNFPYDALVVKPGSFDVTIGPNHFSRQGFTLDLKEERFTLKGELRFGEGQAWPVHWYSPGIMGFFGWLNSMECYHGLLSFDHAIDGFLDINGQKLDFTGGRGYIEKDWGKAFPHSWLWLQTNHFTQPGTSLSASVAIIPWLGTRFKGVIVGLWYGERLYAFSTYNLTRVRKFELGEHHASLHLQRGRYSLQIEAHKTGGGILEAPVPDGMDRRITESLQSTAHVVLIKRGRVIFEDTGVRAGMEIVGDIHLLMGKA